MPDSITIPTKTFPDGEVWLLLEPILGKRVVLRAHEIDVKNAVDYDSHHCPEAHAKGSVKCKSKIWAVL